MAVLRYTGEIATTFDGIGEVIPRGTFTVPDEEAEPWLRRSDMERADPEPEQGGDHEDTEEEPESEHVEESPAADAE